MHPLLFLLFILVSLCFSQKNYPFSGKNIPIFVSSPFTSDLFQANTKLGAQFAVSHVQPVEVCIHRFPLNHVSPVYWNISCSFYFTYPASPDGVPITNQETTFILDIPYYFGVALFEPANDRVMDTIDILIGQTDANITDTCPSGEIYDRYAGVGEPQCKPVFKNIMLNVNNIQMGGELERVYYSFDVPDNTGSIMATTTSPESANKLIFIFRREGTPSDTRKDGTAGSNAYLEFPRPGKYYLSVKSIAKVTGATFMIRTDICQPTTGGPGCRTSYNSSMLPNLRVRTEAGVYKYWSLFVPRSSVVPVTIIPEDGDIWNYQLFASKGQLPQAINADIHNCYNNNCNSVLRINISSGFTDENWYISVLPRYTNKTYAIWFNSTCAPGCDNHGTCQESGPDQGKCNCYRDYTGAACQLTDTKRARNIVLIIIASLLAASALAGFVAQAVLKRHKGYQAV